MRSASSTKPAAPEALQAVALAEGLARALDPLGKDRHELVLLEQPQGVEGRGRDAAHLADCHRDPGQAEGPVEHQEARVARQRVLAQQAHRDHRRVPGQDPGVVGHHQRAPVSGDVGGADRLHPPPAVVEEVEEGEHQVGELLVEAPLVLAVVAVQPPRRPFQGPPGVARQHRGAADQRLGGVQTRAQAVAHELQGAHRRPDPHHAGWPAHAAALARRVRSTQSSTAISVV